MDTQVLDLKAQLNTTELELANAEELNAQEFAKTLPTPADELVAAQVDAANAHLRIKKLEEELTTQKVRLTPILLPSAQPTNSDKGSNDDTNQLLFQLNERVSQLENLGNDATINWPAVSEIACIVAQSDVRSEKHAENVKKVAIKAFGPQLLLMLESWSSFFSRPLDAEFWDTWEFWGQGLISANVPIVDRINSEAEAWVVNSAQAKLKAMVSYPIAFNLTDAMEILLAALPSAQFCFQPKTRIIVDYYNLLRSLVSPRTTNGEAVKVLDFH